MTYTFSVAARSQLDALLQVDDYSAAYILPWPDILRCPDAVTRPLLLGDPRPASMPAAAARLR